MPDSVRQFLACWFSVVGVTLTVYGQDAPQPAEDFALGRAARALLAARCFPCHGPDPASRKADLRLDRAELWLGAESPLHEIVAPEHANESLILERVRHADPSERMPPPHAGDPLTAQEIALLDRWIREGANLPAHWSFQPLNTELPAAEATDSESPIDRLLAACWSAHDVPAAAQADRATLLRRASLDLLGLPPTPAEIAAFENDAAPDAWERVLDRLLHSPHYGERRARHWLDLARYADSNGYANDQPRSIWPYRDWVIQAFDEDMGFDRFTIAQLAGDLLPDATREDRVATGFARNSPLQQEGGSDAEQYRVEAQVNRTEAVAATWLGLTLGCARCHDHKYDPLTARDYYSLYAFFEQCDDQDLALPTPNEAERLRELEGAAQKARAQLTAYEPQTREEWILPRVVKMATAGAQLERLDDGSLLATGENPANDHYDLQIELAAGTWQALRLEALTHPSLPRQGPGRAPNGNFVLAILALSFEDGTAIEISTARADHEQKGYPIADALDGSLKKGWAIGGIPAPNTDREAQFFFKAPIVLASPQVLRLQLKFREDDGAPRYNIGRFRVSVTEMDPSALEMGDKEGVRLRLARDEAANAVQKYKATFAKTLVLKQREKPRATFIHQRGDFLNPGAAVSASTPSCLPPLQAASDAQPPTRLDLAHWLVDGQNPLVARVAVNRLWAELFGQGLVPTHEDFGTQGEYPTHPELLDWLAQRFVALNWSTRELLREIMLSRAYRQSSNLREDLIERDPRNLWIARQSRWRVEAEIVRDLALAASGALAPKIGGPSVYPPMPPELMRLSSSGNKWPTSEGQSRYRRGLYTATFRANEYALTATFDAPDRVNSCTRRTRSNTPLQALALANDPMFLELAQRLALRLIEETSATASEIRVARIERGFLLALGRVPIERERTAIVRYLDRLQSSFRTDPQAAQAFLGTSEGNIELALWTAYARLLLNLDEFLTRS